MSLILMGVCTIKKLSLRRCRDEERIVKQRDEERIMKQSDEVGLHIRGHKDLLPVNCELSASSIPICPATSVELNGINPVFCCRIVRTAGSMFLSERAINELGAEVLQEEYASSPLTDLIQLAPSSQHNEGNDTVTPWSSYLQAVPA